MIGFALMQKGKPMADLIERQAAIDAMNGLPKYSDDGVCLDYADVLAVLSEHLPSVQPEQRWIPCSKRLPEDGETVIVQFDDGDMEILTFPNIYKKLNRVAWMPLPEPWRGEEHEQSRE